MKLFPITFFIFIFFSKNEKIDIWPDIFYPIQMEDEETIFNLEVKKPKDNQKMKIELFLSHPSYFQINFNYTDKLEYEEEDEIEEDINKEIENELEEDEQNENNKEEEKIIEEKEEKSENKTEEENEIEEEVIETNETIKEKEQVIKKEEYINEEIRKNIVYLSEKNFFEKSLRKLYEFPNKMIELEEEYSQKKIYILNLNKNMTVIQLIIKQIKDIPGYSFPSCYIKYQNNEKEFKNYIFSNELKASLINSEVCVYFKGIVPNEENITEEFNVKYEAFLYKKDEKKEIENINYIFSNRYNSRSGTKESNEIRQRNYELKLTGIEQNGKEQWLVVEAEVTYGNDREFFVYNVTLVYIENKNIVIPDEGKDNETDNITNTDNDNNNNDLKFYVIIISFAVIIILIFIIIFAIIYKNKGENFDLDENYGDHRIIEEVKINENTIN